MVANVAQEAMQAPQNWRREMGAVVSGIVECDLRENHRQSGNMEATLEILRFPQKCGLPLAGDYNFARQRRIL
jgi:hypothetical protein